MSEELTKLLLPVENDDGTIEIESVWAAPESADRFRIDNVPFYARGYALHDVVVARAEGDGAWRAQGVAVASGHSTIRLLFADSDRVQAVRDKLRARGCSSERDTSRLVAVDVPPSVPYAELREYLEQQEQRGVFAYEEGCLGAIALEPT